MYVAEMSLKHKKYSFGKTDLENHLRETTNVNCRTGLSSKT